MAAESQEVMSTSSGMSISDIEMEVSSRTPELSEVTALDPDLLPQRLSFSEETAATDSRQDGGKQSPPTPDLSAIPTTAADVDDGTYLARCVAVEEEEQVGVMDSGLEEALGAVVSSLDDYRGQFPELQLLEDELKLLQVHLKVRWEGGIRTRPLLHSYFIPNLIFCPTRAFRLLTIMNEMQ